MDGFELLLDEGSRYLSPISRIEPCRMHPAKENQKVQLIFYKWFDFSNASLARVSWRTLTQK